MGANSAEQLSISELGNLPKRRKELAPMLRHYLELKQKHPEHALLFQVGDFYEVFFDDAPRVAEVLGIRLTARNKDQPEPVPMCGVPHHALHNYIPKLLDAGISCMLVSQVEQADKNRKGMVKREITRVITPGVRYDGDGLISEQFNFVAAAYLSPQGEGAVAYADVSTGHLRVCELSWGESISEILERIAPSELILPSVFDGREADARSSWMRSAKDWGRRQGIHRAYRAFASENRQAVMKKLGRLFPGFEIAENLNQFSRLGREALISLSAILSYVEEVSYSALPLFSVFKLEESSNVVVIDATTRRNLELTETRIDGERKNSLLKRIDRTRTSMGCRKLRDWILAPSRSIEEINLRLEAVEEFINSKNITDELRDILATVRDLDRLLSRIGTAQANPQDLYVFGDSLKSLPRIDALLNKLTASRFKELKTVFDSLDDISKLLLSALDENAPTKMGEGGIFRKGYNAEVDRLRDIRTRGRSLLMELEERERNSSGISSLKIKYNNVFGYFLEVTKIHLSKVPDYFERKQTLVNAERYVTRELKDLEQEILSAKGKQIELEKEVFVELRKEISEHVSRVKRASEILAELDALCSFAQIASENNYCRPVVTDDSNISIKGGRHPVVEQVVGLHNFVPNDVFMNVPSLRFSVLTGPNMGGKSTYLRQVGLIQLLAQAGSFVPAEKAEIAIVDRIFTRIGAADDLSRGDSTFMVEMREAGSILRQATQHSLVLIDEVGRGTATTDGLAIAQAIAEWLLNQVRCKTIFATHFHELTALGNDQTGAFCLSVGVVERQDGISFTHRIEERESTRSYGIEVARLAGLPEGLLLRAKELLAHLATDTGITKYADFGRAGEESGSLPSLQVSPRLEKIQAALEFIEINKMTPLQALETLSRLKSILQGK